MRIKFKHKKERERFFQEALKKNFETWNQFSKFLNLNRKLFLEYRNGNLTIPEEIYTKCHSLINNHTTINTENIIKVNDNWGKIKGGKENYKLNKNNLDSGREKAIKKKQNQIKKFNIYTPLTKDIAYIIGLYIGDGFSNKYQRYYLTQFIGHKSEYSYYKTIITKIIFNFSKIKPIIKEYKGNYIRINYYSKYLHDFFTYRFKIKSGRKSHCVLIPQEIINSSEEIICECIAGIYDAEASFYFDERKKYKKPYPILEFHINNQNLSNQIRKIFESLNINYYTRKEGNKIYMYGEKSIKKFLKKINIKNHKLIKKIPKTFFA